MDVLYFLPKVCGTLLQYCVVKFCVEYCLNV